MNYLIIGRKPILAELLKSVKAPSGHRYGHPVVTLSYAQSLDGSITVRRGKPYSLSGSESRILTHKLRAAHDAVLVGIDTIIADNPSLTVRFVEGQNPLPIVLDSHLRLPFHSNLLKNGLLPLVATTTSASPIKQKKLETLGAKIVRTLPDDRGWVDLNSLLRQLLDLGINTIMVEGGARVITSFLTQRLVDRIVITIAPTLLGGLHAIEYPLNGRGNGSSALPEFEDCKYEQIGQDMIFSATLSRENQ